MVIGTLYSVKCFHSKNGNISYIIEDLGGQRSQVELCPFCPKHARVAYFYAICVNIILVS